MTTTTTTPAPPEAETMQCMEVWGGSNAVDVALGFSGLDAWVHSRPSGRAGKGGDIHYLSSCATGRVARLVVADVSGHGAEVAPISEALRGLMRRFVNYIDQSGLVAELNRSFHTNRGAGANAGTFATALVMSWFGPRQELGICNAGHPAPLLCRKGSSDWSSVTGDEAQPEAGGSLRNIPLGVLEEANYDLLVLRLEKGDQILAFTDAVIETFGSGSARKGEEILRAFLQARPAGEEPGDLIEALVSELEARGSDDDLTILLVRPNGKQPWRGVSRRLGGPIRVMGAVLAGLFKRSSQIPWPEMSLANLGGALFEPFNRIGKRRRR